MPTTTPSDEVVPEQARRAAPAPVPGRRVLALPARLDVSSAPDVRLAVSRALESGTGDLVLDAAATTVLDAPGLGVLVGAHRRAQRAGRGLVLLDVSPPLARLLFLTRLDRVLRLERSAVPVPA